MSKHPFRSSVAGLPQPTGPQHIVPGAADQHRTPSAGPQPQLPTATPVPGRAAAQHPAGQPATQTGWPQSQPVPVGVGGLGVAGFICGLVGLVLFLLAPVAMILALLGLALSGTGLWLARRDGTPAGLSIAGLTCSVLAVVLSGILLIAAS